MRKYFCFIILILIPISLSAQYYNERTIEHNYEQSDMFFKSSYLNPFGIHHLKDISIGFIDDPFLNVQLNPAILPKLKNGTTEVYLDFRGDRTESRLLKNYSVPAYYDQYYGYNSYIPDYRQITETRNESEPIFSLGIINYPFSNKFYVGGTFQYLHSKDKFYSPTFSIYNSNFYADGYAKELARSSDIPVIDRYAGKDEMIQKGIIFSAFAGYEILSNLSIGLNFNTIDFDRNGDYLNENNDDYGNVDDNIYENKNLKSRKQDYDHTDIALGLSYKTENKFILGVKAGLLDGNVIQDHLSQNRYLSQYKEPNVSSEWYYHISDYNSSQSWDHDGKTKYLGFNFSKQVKSSSINGYYKYSKTDIDASTKSSLRDTSFSSNRWQDYNTNTYSTSLHHSLTSDIRDGTGERDSKKHEGMINVKWNLTENTNVYTGFYFSKNNSTVVNTENAVYKRRYHYERTGSYARLNHNELNEDKVLTWNYENEHTTFQIPIIFDFTLNNHFGIMLGVNRVFHDWNISSITSVYLKKRTNDDNGEVKEENDFIERYIEPTDTYTEDYTDVFTKLNVNVTKELQVNLLLNPEFDDTFRIAQWWLSFRANL